jgi:REP element-mobilizing transposase RayT
MEKKCGVGGLARCFCFFFHVPNWTFTLWFCPSITANYALTCENQLAVQAILKGKYEYRRRLPHYQGNDQPIFVTFRALYQGLLPESVRGIVLQHCLHDNGTKAHFLAVVVMPDHVHLLLTPLRNPSGESYSLLEILQAIKGTSAHTVNRALGRSGPLWQDESFDHVPRREEGLREKLEYIRQNPVKRGLVRRPEDYPWLWTAPELKDW